jgi:3-oxoadipate enol-lactonase
VTTLRHAAADLRSVAAMFQPLRSATQVRAPALPWTQTSVVDRGDRGRLSVRHTPGVGADGRVPLVLLHGITWTADLNFFGLGEAIRGDQPVIVFDAPNHGTGLSVPRFTFDDVADDLEAVLDHFGVAQAVVCGYSLGGICAMVFADRHPSRTAGIIVQAAAMRYGVDARERAFLAAVAAVHCFGLDRAIRSLPLRYLRASAHRSHAVRDRWAWIEQQFSGRPVHGLHSIWRAVHRSDHRALRCAAPAVVIVFGDDRVCPPYLQREVAAVLRARVIEIAADHDLPVADPPAYARVTTEALDWVLSRS